MLRIPFIIFVLFLNACTQDSEKYSKYQQGNNKEDMIDITGNEYKLTARFNAFDTTVEVLFRDTKDSISDTQKKNLDGFIARQDSLMPEIIQKIFDFYKSSRPDYKEGWSMHGSISEKELEKNLPIPTTPEKLKPYITPAIVHIQNKKNCTEGTMGIEFDCTWDIENGLGVAIQNWKVIKAGVAEIAYF